MVHKLSIYIANKMVVNKMKKKMKKNQDIVYTKKIVWPIKVEY